MPKYRTECWVKFTQDVEANSTAEADAILDAGIARYAEGACLKIGTVQIDPPLPPPPPDKPKPTTPIRPRGGRPNGGGSPGTPVLGRYTITKAEAA